MSTLAIVLVILATAALLWQLTIAALGFAMMASGKFRNVKIGMTPGIVAVILFIVAVLV